ncbi:MAG TPA: hypothetical protein VIR01_00945, partial [Pyrinomonadaceae bacterium]
MFFTVDAIEKQTNDFVFSRPERKGFRLGIVHLRHDGCVRGSRNKTRCTIREGQRVDVPVSAEIAELRR